MASALRKILPRWMRSILRPLHAIIFLRWPPALLMARRRRRAQRAKTYSAKLGFKLACDRRDLLTLFADKFAVRDYVRRRIGPELLTKLHAADPDPRRIAWDALPREFVTKVNHGSGGTVIVWEGADPNNQLPEKVSAVGWSTWVIHPDRLDRNRLMRLLDHWLTLRFGWGLGTNYEWAYQEIRPMVLVEELLRTPSGGLPPDYRMFVFNGVCRMIQLDSERNADATASGGRVGHSGTVRDFFDRNWSRFDVRSSFANSEVPPARPAPLEQMIEYAELLGGPTDFVRADFYLVGDRLVFGELTNYPTGGTGHFDPPEFDALVGSWWELPDSYWELPDIPYEPAASMRE